MRPVEWRYILGRPGSLATPSSGDHAQNDVLRYTLEIASLDGVVHEVLGMIQLYPSMDGLSLVGEVLEMIRNALVRSFTACKLSM
jgi:hypothetical protein